MHDHDLGLAHDLTRLQEQAAQRRHALRWLMGAGALALAGCGGGSSGEESAGNSGAGSSGGGGSANASCTVIPEETAGPYPGDGSNTSNGGVANALLLSGIVRADIRSSIAGASGVAAGVPLSIVIDLVNTNGSCADLSGYAIYLWHCDREGRYSMYSSGVTAENYLRGVQATGSDGTATFTTIFPGCYAGRMPHVHFEVYRSTTAATSFSNKLRTSQIAFPTDVCNTVYASSGYGTSATNFARITFASDNIFSDGYTTQLATVTGGLANGYVAHLQVGIAA